MTPSHPSALNYGDQELKSALETLERTVQTGDARQAFQTLKAHLLQNARITQIDQELDAHLEMDRVVEILLRWSIEVTSAQRGWVLVGGEEAGETEDAPSLVDPAVRDALQSGTPVTLPLPGADLQRLVAPLIHHGEAVGVILIDRPNVFTPSEIAFFSLLCRRAASAVENARLYAAVQSANQAKTKFVSVVTHELRIPMTSIKGYTDLLRKGLAGELNEMQVSFLNTIRNNVERMSALVSDLSDISRIETGRVALQLSQMPVQPALQEAVQTLQPRLDEKHQALELAAPDDLPEVYADKNRVVQILINLLSNASKYSPEGSRILLKAEAHAQGVRVEVSDAGIGIHPDDQRRLFSQFFRSENQAVREQPGWGLGLHVTRLLVELMGGSIGVESTLGQGSQFWFILPTSAQAAGG